MLDTQKYSISAIANTCSFSKRSSPLPSSSLTTTPFSIYLSPLAVYSRNFLLVTPLFSLVFPKMLLIQKLPNHIAMFNLTWITESHQLELIILIVCTIFYFSESSMGGFLEVFLSVHKTNSLSQIISLGFSSHVKKRAVEYQA